MNAIATDGLGRRYGRRWALRECTVDVSAGRAVGLVGANGSGKTTLLHLAVGLLEPTEGGITVLGGRPVAGPDQLGRVGFLAQDAPVYESFSVGDHPPTSRTMFSVSATAMAPPAAVGFSRARPSTRPDVSSPTPGSTRSSDDHANVTSRTSTADLGRCVDRLGWHDVVRMHPASQFWSLQALEAASFVILVAVFVLGAFWWIRGHAA